jgi:trigger factor
LNITVTDQERCRKQIALEIPSDAVRSEIEKVVSDLAPKVSIAGFRPGHVPKSVVKTRFRKEIRDEVASKLVPQALEEAIQERDIKMVGRPEMSELKFEDDESINVTFAIDVAPEFEIANYKGITLTENVYTVTEDDVDRTLARIQDEHAELVPVEDRPAQKGDLVAVSLEQTVGKREGQTPKEGDAPSGLGTADSEADVASAADKTVERADVEIEIGGADVLPEFSEALSGVAPGDIRAFTVDYPAGHQTQRLSGQKVGYKAEVTAIRKKELPELDDDFAHTLNNDISTVDELKKWIRLGLEHEAKHKSESELRSAARDYLDKANQFEVPENLVERQLDAMMEMLESQLLGRGMRSAPANIDWRGLRETQRKQAEREVRSLFTLQRIAELEKLDASEEEIDREIEAIADASGKPQAVLKARLTKENRLDSIKEQIEHRKALDLVVASADLTREEVAGPDSASNDGESGQAEESEVQP